jgi:adenosylcobinamide-phosphate synthase
MIFGRTAIVLVAAFILDCIFGDPQNPYHPIRLIGSFIALGVKAHRSAGIKNPAAQFAVGATLTALTVGASFLITGMAVRGIYSLHYAAGLCFESAICYFLIAPKALCAESSKVRDALKAGDLNGARDKLSYIVGRDTCDLGEAEIVKATVETVSENLSDAVIAPLLFIFIGGAPLGMAYKAANTLDSMIGYKNDEYKFFGKFAARFDDAINLIPSRISAMLMIAGCLFARADAKRAIRIYTRDRYNHSSPNSAQTESVCAGALGLRLGGDSRYMGVLVRKPYIGDDVNQPSQEHICEANRLIYAAAIMAVILLAAAGAAYHLYTVNTHV